MKRIRFLLLTLVALLTGINASATKTVYVDPVGTGTWMTDNPAISLYVFGSGDGWANSETLSDGVIKFTFDDKYTSMIIVRGPQANANSFTNKWNQSGDITDIQLGKLYKANGYTGDDLTYTVETYFAYKVDFNTEISTSSHDFAVASKWKHIVEDNDGSYVGYKWDDAYGTGNPATGGLLVYSQKVGSSSWDMANVYDLLVTPKVSGTIKLKVKAYENASSSTKAFVQLYALNGTATEKADILKEFQTEIPGYNTGTGDWVELTYNVTETKRIGIRAQYVYIDDFSAETIDTTPEAALVVSSVMSNAGQSGTQGTNPIFEQQADGSMKVILKVTLSNTGDVDFVAGTTENYTLTAAQASYTSGAKTYYNDASIAIPEDLAAGESKTFDVEFTVPYVADYKYWYVKENVTGTTSTSYRYATSVAYQSKFVLRVAESGSTSDLTTAQDYGRISAADTRSFEIYNDGTAPLTIKSITLPEGFTSDNLPEIPVGGLVLAKKEATAAFNVTLPVTTTGDFAGNLVIKYVNAGDAEESTKTLAFSGSVLAEGTWFADFNGDKSNSTSGVYPEGGVVTSSTTLQFGSTGSYGSYDHYLKSYSSAGTLVMPKLTATAGAQLKYDAVKYQSGSSYYLKVYVSTDRKTWGEPVATINNSDLETSGQRYSQTMTFDEAGDYYVAFELKGVGLDNVIGLTKTAVAHDLYLKSTSLVAEAQTGSTIKPSVTVIPLTAETADGYTVKYYVDDVAVAEGTAENLSVSATAEKTFVISYTPNDEVTTTHDTYIEFEFTNGTKITTEHQALKVTNEPKFLFVAANTSVNQYTTSLTTAQAFGKTNTADTKTFKIYNQGTAVLHVTGITAPEGFSVNKTEAFDVAAGANEDIIVTFSTSTPGEYAGNLVVTYVQDAAEPYTLAFSGIKLDSSKFYANFDNASSSSIVWPAGLVYESGIGTSYSGYGPYNCYVYTSASTTENNKLITPLLHANAGDKFCFDVKQYSSWGTRKAYVYLSTDRKTWGEPIYTNESITNSNFETVEATITEAGDYYVGIAMTGIYVDELYGLTPVAVAHDWKIASSNIPAAPMQNVTQTATVNILNLGLADEAADSYTVTAYVNGEAAGTGTAVAIPMNHQLGDAGTQLSVNFLSSKAGTFPVYLEVKAGDYSVTTDPVDVVFSPEIATAEPIEIGSGSTTSNSYAPIDFFNFEQARTSDILYTAAQLNAFGLKSGDKITSLAFRGTLSSPKTIANSSLKAWVALSTGDITFGSPEKASMTEVTVYNAGEMAFVSGVNTVTIALPTPIVYDGTSDLRIYLEGGGNSEYVGLNFAYDTNYSNMKWSNASSKKYNPLLYVTLSAEPATLSGTVKTSADAAIAEATVTLKAANGVEYTGKTDAEGAYNINVIQAGLDFTATIEKYGFLKKAFALNMGGANAVRNVTLYTQYGIVGDFPFCSSWEDDKVMTQDPENPNIFTYVSAPVALDATKYYYKLRADGAWGLYELPSSGNNNWDFSGGWYGAGTYKLIFTFDESKSNLEPWEQLTLEPVLQLTLANSEAAAGTYHAKADVTVARTLKAGWNAVVLPFAMTADDITTAFGANAEVAVFDGAAENAGGVSIDFAKATATAAGTPFLLYLEAAPASDPVFDGKDIDFEAHNGVGADNTFDFVGTFANTTAAAGDFIMAGGKFKNANGGNAINAYRAYLKNKGVSSARVNFYMDGILIDEAEVTAITGVKMNAQQENVYNLSGQKINNELKKGVYIINGKKVVVK